MHSLNGGCGKGLTRARDPEGNLSRQRAHDPAAEAVDHAVLRRGGMEDDTDSRGQQSEVRLSRSWSTRSSQDVRV